MVLLLLSAPQSARVQGVGGLVYPTDVAVDPEGTLHAVDPGRRALLRLAGAVWEVVRSAPAATRGASFGARYLSAEPRGGWVVSDSGSVAVYRVGRDGGLAPLAGPEALVAPAGIAVGPGGETLVVDRSAGRLLALGSGEGGEIEELARVHAAKAVAIGPGGDVVVLADRTLWRLRAGRMEPLAPADAFEMAHDVVALPAGGFAVSDGYARCLLRVTSTGAVAAIARAGPLASPQGLALDRDGALLVADPRAKAIFRVTLSGDVTVRAR